jgi:hypothetical protein
MRDREFIHRERSYGGSYHWVITLIAAIKSWCRFPRGLRTVPARLFSLLYSGETTFQMCTERQIQRAKVKERRGKNKDEVEAHAKVCKLGGRIMSKSNDIHRVAIRIGF